MSTALDVTSTALTHWKYISEGGSSIVFSYTGPSSAEFDRTALRLRKAPHGALMEPLSDDQQIAGDPDDPTIVFQCEVIERLLPEEFLPRLEAVHVSRMWLEGLAQLTEEKRPAERRAKDAIDTRKRKAVLATDLVGGKGFAVEIKASLSHSAFPVKISRLTPCLFFACSQNGDLCPPLLISRLRPRTSRRRPVGSVCTRTSSRHRARTCR